MKQTCTYCGFNYSAYFRYELKEKARLNPKEGWLWGVRRKRRVARLKETDRRTFLRVLVTLREHKELLYTNYELKQALKMKSVSPITKTLKLMYELGIVQKYNVNGAWYWKFEVTGYRREEETIEDKIKAERDPLKRKILRMTPEEKEIYYHEQRMKDKSVCRYVQRIKDNGEVEGEFVWVSKEVAQKIDERKGKLF